MKIIGKSVYVTFQIEVCIHMLSIFGLSIFNFIKYEVIVYLNFYVKLLNYLKLKAKIINLYLLQFHTVS